MKKNLQLSLVKKIINIVKQNKNLNNSIHEPYFDKSEKKVLNSCIESSYVSTVGPFVKKFENLIKKFTGAKYVVATVNGISALHISMIVSNVSKNDEVLIPSLNYVGSSNAASYCGAIPHFIDSRKDSFEIDVLKLRNYLLKVCKVYKNKCINKKTNRIIKAIVPTHILGHVSDMDSLLKLSKEFKLKIIEDSAECVGSYYKGKHAGTIGLIGILSFNGNKIITTGGGGAILTNNKKAAQEARHLTQIGKIEHQWRYHYDVMGFNYKMPNINAAIGCAQMKKIKFLLRKKRNIFYNYYNKLKNDKNFRIVKEPKKCKSNYWLNAIILKKSNQKIIDVICKKTYQNDVHVRPLWQLVNEIPYFKKNPKMDLSNSKNINKKTLCLPSSPNSIKL